MGINKSGVVNANSFIEPPINVYDNNFYTESDNSIWTRIVHHNNPASYRFSSTDPFMASVYIDTNRWFIASLCDLVDIWELMIIQTQTSGGTVEKYRWIQHVNPMTAVFGDVDAADVTKITSSGYTTPGTSYGGIYKFNSNSFFVCNNGNSGNWWGAIGCWTAYDGGIPGYNQKVVTTGYIDLYLRLKIKTQSNRLSIYNSTISANTIIEL